MPTPEGRRHLDPEALEKVSYLELRARRVVEGFITGMHKSPYHGFAVEFASHREYVPGDEVRRIDWKLWARADRFYIKEYEEETNLSCTILLDCSKSMAYGGGLGGGDKKTSKFDYAATLSACLAYLVQQQQDAAGLIAFDNDVRVEVPAAARPGQFKLLLEELGRMTPDHRSDVGDVFHRLADRMGGRGLVVLVSDLFVDVASLVGALKHFRHKRHEVVVMHVLHEDELAFPFKDNTQFRGLETESRLLVDPRQLRKTYLEVMGRFLGGVRKACADTGIDYVQMSTAQAVEAALTGYLMFRRRIKRAARAS